MARAGLHNSRVGNDEKDIRSGADDVASGGMWRQFAHDTVRLDSIHVHGGDLGRQWVRLE